jgi:hypothetical protein
MISWSSSGIRPGSIRDRSSNPHPRAEQDLLLAHQLRDPPLTEAPQHVELEEPVARLDESDRASQVDRIGGLDVRDPVVVEIHVDIGSEPHETQGLVPIHRMAGTDPIGEDRSQGSGPKDGKEHEESSDHTAGCQLLHSNSVSASRGGPGVRPRVRLGFYQESAILLLRPTLHGRAISSILSRCGQMRGW